MCFPIHKGYYGKPTHHKGASYLFSGSKIKTAKPPGSSRDALGLITIYPRPDEPICSHFQYSIKVNLCQHKPSICRYNGLPVHAIAQTGKPLLGIQDAQRSPAQQHRAG